MAVVAYVPVLHEGYLALFRRHTAADYFCILGEQLIGGFDYLRKEIRAIHPRDAEAALRVLFPDQMVLVVEQADLRELARRRLGIVMPDEDICHMLAGEYFKDSPTTFVRTFLRWDRKSALEEISVTPDKEISVTDLDRELIRVASRESEKSSDWWRQVGAVLVRDGAMLLVAHNRHLPTGYTPYLDGDPRNAFSRGVHIELGTVLHAEQAIICESARRGISTEGAWLYTTVFPCPSCAKAIAASGIARVYFAEGYAMLDGERILRDFHVLIVQVQR